VNSKPGANGQQVHQAPSTQRGPLASQRWFDDLHWILIRVVKSKDQAPEGYGFALWMESSVFASPRQRIKCCRSTRVVPSFLAAQSGYASSLGYTGCKQAKSITVKPHVSCCRRRAAR